MHCRRVSLPYLLVGAFRPDPASVPRMCPLPASGRERLGGCVWESRVALHEISPSVAAGHPGFRIARAPLGHRKRLSVKDASNDAAILVKKKFQKKQMDAPGSMGEGRETPHDDPVPPLGRRDRALLGQAEGGRGIPRDPGSGGRRAPRALRLIRNNGDGRPAVCPRVRWPRRCSIRLARLTDGSSPRWPTA